VKSSSGSSTLVLRFVIGQPRFSAHSRLRRMIVEGMISG
jgi:hypothetical protein